MPVVGDKGGVWNEISKRRRGRQRDKPNEIRRRGQGSDLDYRGGLG